MALIPQDSECWKSPIALRDFKLASQEGTRDKRPAQQMKGRFRLCAGQKEEDGNIKHCSGLVLQQRMGLHHFSELGLQLLHT